jgi:hypothetical protein
MPVRATAWSVSEGARGADDGDQRKIACSVIAPVAESARLPPQHLTARQQPMMRRRAGSAT